MRKTTTMIAAAAAAAILQAASARAGIETWTAASGFPGNGADHPGGGFFQYDPGLWDTGIDAAPRNNPAAGAGDGEFAYTGSDGAFHMEVYTLLGAGRTGAATDHAAHLVMDYNPNPPNTFFGSFWFGGIGVNVGSFPKLAGTPVPNSRVLVYADVIAPAGAHMEMHNESAYTSQGNGSKTQFTGTGTWQTVGGQLSSATPYGSFNYNDLHISSIIAFGWGDEITQVDNGSDPNNHPNVTVDNMTMTIDAAAWTGTAGGTWNDNTKWDIIAPDGGNAKATFGNVGAAPQTITMGNMDHFAGTLVFDNANAYTIAGTGTAVLNLRAIGAGTFASVQVLSGSHTVSAPVALWGDTTFSVNSSSSTMTMSDLQDSAVTIVKTGAGNAAFNRIRQAGLTVNAGTVTVLTNGSANSASKVATLTIAGGPATPTAALDLQDNDAVVGNLSYADTTSMIAFARHGGAWDRPGITSTAAQAAPHITSLGVLKGTEFHTLNGPAATFDGLSVANTDMVIKYTYYGDTDLNGQVNGADYARIDQNFNNQVSQGNIAGWVNGDFDYNGKIDGADYALIDSAFNGQAGTVLRLLSFADGSDRNRSTMTGSALGMALSHFDEFGESYAASVLANVPEPTSLALVALGCTTLLKRRRAR